MKPISELLKPTVVLLTMIINKIKGSCMRLFPINRLVNYTKKIFKKFYTNQNSKPLEIEDKINITLVIN